MIQNSKNTSKKILADQMGFSFDGGELKSAKELETYKWLQEKNVTLLSSDKDALGLRLSNKFRGRNLIRLEDANIEANNDNTDDISKIDEVEEDLQNSKSEVYKMMHDQLKTMQGWSLNKKIDKAISVLEEAANEFGLENLLLCDSGGKDSAVLSHIATRHWGRNILHGFSNTRCEFPETYEIIKKKSKSVEIVMVSSDVSFNYVVKNYGFPMVSKNISKSIRIYNRTNSEETRWKIKDYMERRERKWVNALGCPFSEICCDKLKKSPLRRFQNAFGYSCAIVGTTAQESRARTNDWIEHGCNSFEGKNPKSAPLSIWTEEDIWEYINKYKLELNEIYSMGYERNGCLYCGFGVHLQAEGKNRIKMLEKTHPYAYGVFLRNYAKYFDLMKKLGYDGFDY